MAHLRFLCVAAFAAFLGISCISFSLENLGVHGNIYRIEEKNILSVIKEGGAPIRISKQELQRLIYKVAEVRLRLPVAKSSRYTVHEIVYTVPRDIYVGGRLLAKKGEKINVLERVKLRRIYVVLNDYMLSEFIGFVKRYPNTTFLIAQGNVYELSRKYPDLNIYGAFPRIVKALKVEKVPSIVYQHENKLYVVEVPWQEGKALLPF